MDTIKIRYDGKVFVPQSPINLPVGFEMEIPFTTPAKPAAAELTLLELAKQLEKYPINPDWPEDGAAQHDHYLYGLPKRP